LLTELEITPSLERTAPPRRIEVGSVVKGINVKKTLEKKN